MSLSCLFCDVGDFLAILAARILLSQVTITGASVILTDISGLV
jgi:hypothetical protein